MAATMAWVENFLNLTNGYYEITSNDASDDQFVFVVPFPPDYTSTMNAYWTTDVIAYNPSCSWQTATTTAKPIDSSWVVTLPQSNFSIKLTNDSFGMFLSFLQCFHVFSRFQYQALSI